MRSPNKDEIIEILIVQYADWVNLSEAVNVIYGREATYDEVKLVDTKIREMRRGWVAMNLRTKHRSVSSESV